MPTLAPKRFTAWSMSRLNDYRQCPAKAKYKHLDRLPEPSAPAMQRGSDIHAAAAAAIMQPARAKLAPELARFKDEFKGVRQVVAEYKQTELQWSFSSAWALLPTFFDPATWVRMVLDLRYVIQPGKVKVVDHKTGKIYEKNREQNKLYALGEFKAHPDTEVVETELWYLDQGEIVKDVYERKEVPALLKYWDTQSRPLMRATAFPPTPSSLCSWCAYSRAKGGPCEY
jgi:hypothetical protein